jgi:UDP-GlcNAc:undecaprenyl-phosphate/decaprenyl-phosphate GlcNAc-1-phosphate transferase
MIELLISLVIAFGITAYAIPIIITVAESKKLFDLPDARKIHKKPIPALGGLGTFAGFMMAMLVTIPFHDSFMSFQYVVAACLVMFFVGVKDDVLMITPIKKFLGQLLAACILVYKGGFVLTDMHGILGIYQLPQSVSFGLTIFTIIVVTNAFNLIDGVDGLAGSLGSVVMLGLGVYFAVNKDIEYACLAFAMLGALLAFLIFNFQPARIFMGDTGSLLLGLVASVLIIHFIQKAPTATIIPFQSAPAVGFAILFVPLFDTLRVFSIRIVNRRSPFSPDRNHIHHILLDKGLSHRMVTLSLVFANVVMILIGCLGNSLDVNLLLSGIISLGLITVGLLAMAKNKARAHTIAFAKTLADKEDPQIHIMSFDANASVQNN